MSDESRPPFPINVPVNAFEASALINHLVTYARESKHLRSLSLE